MTRQTLNPRTTRKKPNQAPLREHKWKTLIEPFKIKMVEPLGFTTIEERQAILQDAAYNLFKIHADKVLIDLLTDSGTSAMSNEQWAGMMRGDASYAGSRSFYIFEKAVRDLTGYREIIPVHQGRAGERILFSLLGGAGKTFLSNTHFDTTRANVEASGAQALDLPAASAWDFEVSLPFKGNMDIRLLQETIQRIGAEKIPLVLMTLTNNSMGGQPVSLKNLRQVSEICRSHDIPLFLDAARFAENAYLIKMREPGYSTRSIREIAQEMFTCAQGCLMSAKKDGLVNMGGFLALDDESWVRKIRQQLILGEGFPTYGGLSGRDLEAVACGLKEVLDEKYLRYRLRSIAYLANGLRSAGAPIVEPPGGHAVYVDAKRFLPHIPPQRFPAQALACALYLESGIRTVEVGSLMFGRTLTGRFQPAKMELLRLAVPRRVYTQSHIDYVIEAFEVLAARREHICGLKIIQAPEVLRHFEAKLAPISASGRAARCGPR